MKFFMHIIRFSKNYFAKFYFFVNSSRSKITIANVFNFRFIGDDRSVTVIKPITRVACLLLVGLFQLIFIIETEQCQGRFVSPASYV